MLRAVVFCVLFVLPAQALAAPRLVSRLAADAARGPMVAVTHLGDTRLLVAEQQGLLWLVDAGQAALFADLRMFVSEDGLLGVAVDPADSGRVFVCYNRADDGATVLARFARDAAGTHLEAESQAILLAIERAPMSRAGAALAFGRDGLLYLALGDGGGTADGGCAAQDGALLAGKLLRLDVAQETTPFYRIPRDNPYRESVDVRPEIWAMGVGQPRQLMCDPRDGDLWLLDQGDGVAAVLQVAEGQAGANFGWGLRAGTDCVAAPACQVFDARCDDANVVVPWFRAAEADGDCRLNGAVMHHGCDTVALNGGLFVSETCHNALWRADSDSAALTALTADLPAAPICLGSDAQGELLIALADGAVFQVTEDDFYAFLPHWGDAPSACRQVPLNVLDLLGLTLPTREAGVLSDFNFAAGDTLDKVDGLFTWEGRRTIAVDPVSGQRGLLFSFGPDGPEEDSIEELRYELNAPYVETYERFTLHVPENYYHRAILRLRTATALDPNLWREGDIIVSRTGNVSATLYQVGDQVLYLKEGARYLWDLEWGAGRTISNQTTGATVEVAHREQLAFNNKLSVQWAGAYSSNALGVEMNSDASQEADTPGSSYLTCKATATTEHGQSRNYASEGPRLWVLDPALHNGRAVDIVIRRKKSTSLEAGDGLCQIWRDGELVYTYTTFTTYQSDQNYMERGYIMGHSNSGFAERTDFYVSRYRFYGPNRPAGLETPN